MGGSIRVIRHKRGETVKIIGFGSFEVRDKKPRKGRNPQTGEDIVIDARRVITFGPSAVLKERMNGRRGKAVG
jgi:integration host factor subunit alpha